MINASLIVMVIAKLIDMTPKKAKNIYWGAMPLPKVAKSLGEYDVIGRRGCLIKLASGINVVGNAGVIRNIKQ